MSGAFALTGYAAGTLDRTNLVAQFHQSFPQHIEQFPQLRLARSPPSIPFSLFRSFLVFAINPFRLLQKK